MGSLYKRCFELDPINNITEFSSESGVDVINFIIPALENVMLPTGDLVLSGNLQVNLDSTTPYLNNSNERAGIDNVLGGHGFIDRVEITSRNGNVLLEQRLSYGLCAKMKRSVFANEDLRVGRFNCQNLCAENTDGSKQFLRRNAGDAVSVDGAPFAIQLDTGLLKDNLQMINLSPNNGIGGIEIKITLASTANALFNIDNSDAAADKLDSDVAFTLKNLKLFGRYNYVSPQVTAGMNGVEFKKIDNQLQIIHSSNDTLAFQPQVNSLDKVFYVFQPNSDTKNNFATNNYQMNQLVGLKDYKESRNGVSFPKDFQVDNNTAVPNLGKPIGSPGGVSTPGNVNDRHIKAGSAEQVYHILVGLNGFYPPAHSLVTGENEANANLDLSGQANGDTASSSSTNRYGNNVNGICTSYQYGFQNYATPMRNDLLQLQAQSSVKTSDDIVNSTVRDQNQTTNTLIVYNSSLSYANLSVAK